MGLIIHPRKHHVKMSVRPAIFLVLIVTLHSTRALEAVLFADALYWLSHHLKHVVEEPLRKRLGRMNEGSGL